MVFDWFQLADIAFFFFIVVAVVDSFFFGVHRSSLFLVCWKCVLFMAIE